MITSDERLIRKWKTEEQMLAEPAGQVEEAALEGKERRAGWRSELQCGWSNWWEWLCEKVGDGSGKRVGSWSNVRVSRALAMMLEHDVIWGIRYIWSVS